MTVLEVIDVQKRFGGIRAVGGVSFQVDDREIVGIIGPNGSGKSTLFNLLTGTERPDAGEIRLNGRKVSGWKPYRVARAGMGRTFQIPALFVNMTVRENLYASIVEGDWKAAGDRADHVLELVSLGHVQDTLAGALSGGQQRLLEFGRVLMRDPQLILLDEVAAGVHPNLRKIMLDAIARLQADGRAFVVIEHDMEMVRQICQRIIVMDAGEIVAEGSFEDIANNKSVVEAYLGVPIE